MCGLFGMVRSTDSVPAATSQLCVRLGHLAEERGSAAAGLALADGRSSPIGIPDPASTGTPDPAAADVSYAGWRVIKDALPFSRLWQPAHQGALDAARAVLGHTRYPTQGHDPQLANASPLGVGQVIGTHNGDIDVETVRGRRALPPPQGQTDTEILFQALDAAAGAIEPTLDILAGAIGRAALAWVDLRFPGQVRLARTAISPLAVAVDSDGTLYWASNPGWFNPAPAEAGVRISPEDVWLLPEGTLLIVDYRQGRVRVAERHEFTPTARSLDERLLDDIAHLGFSRRHRQADRALIRHLTRY